jgi:hypothetical protein
MFELLFMSLQNILEFARSFCYGWYRFLNKKYLKNTPKVEVDYNKLLKESTELKNLENVKYCVDHGANNLNECVKIASQNSNYSIVEYLIQKGADTAIALRYSKSPNITNMIYRFEHNSEIIK